MEANLSWVHSQFASDSPPDRARPGTPILAALGVTGSAWLLVAGYAAHGVKDLWQHRTQFVAGSRWWPPFCVTIDFLVAVILAVGIVVGVSLH